jgi:hypothetical protein
MDHFHKIIYVILYFISLFTTVLLFWEFLPGKNKYIQPLTLTCDCDRRISFYVGADYDSYVVWYIDKTCDCDFELGF